MLSDNLNLSMIKTQCFGDEAFVKLMKLHRTVSSDIFQH